MSSPKDIVSIALKMIEQRARRHLKEAQVDRLKGEMVIRIGIDCGEAKVIRSYFEPAEPIIV